MDLKKVFSRYQGFYRKFFYWKRSMYKELAKGQSPEAIIIACSDSRVDPAILTKASLGEIFVVRNVANIVPTYSETMDTTNFSTAAALEFAVNKLKVSHIVIQGHSQCGGINALFKNPDDDEIELVKNWVKTAIPVREKILKEFPDLPEEKQLELCEQESVKLSLQNLMTYPFIKKEVDAGNVTLHGWYFDLVTGQMYDYDFASSTFKKLY